MQLQELEFLVVDDHSLTRNLVRTILQHFGIRCTTADGGKSAMRLLDKGKTQFHCIICDWNMPDMQGIEVLKRTRRHATYKEIPFVLLTAEAEEVKVKAAIEAGVNDYLLKPFTTKKIGDTLHRVLMPVYPDAAKSLLE